MRGKKKIILLQSTGTNHYLAWIIVPLKNNPSSKTFQIRKYTYIKQVLAPVQCLPRNRLGIGASWNSPHTCGGLVTH